METILEGNVLVCHLSGEIDLATAPRLRDELEAVLTDPAVAGLVLEVSRVSFIDSSGLGVILGRYRQLHSQDRLMAIAGAQPGVRRILQMAGLERLVPFYRTSREAVEGMGVKAWIR